jgi:hypothetical protein
MWYLNEKFEKYIAKENYITNENLDNIIKSNELNKYFIIDAREKLENKY